MRSLLARRYLLSLGNHPDCDSIRVGLLRKGCLRTPVEAQLLGDMVKTTPVASQDDPPEDPDYELRVAALSRFLEFLEKPHEFSGEEVAWLASLSVATLLAERVRARVPPPKKVVDRIGGLSPKECLGLAHAAVSHGCGPGELLEREVSFTTEEQPNIERDAS